MNFGMVLLNVLAVFAITGAVCCWICALIAITHRKMRSANWVPALAGIVVASRLCIASGAGWAGMLLGFVAGFFATSMLVAYVYGWVKSKEFDEDEIHEGSGKFAPVMLLWTGCLLYVGIVALVNQAVTGDFTPVHVAGF